MDATDIAGPAPMARMRVHPALIPFLVLLGLAALLPLAANDYWALIATRAAIYWILVAGLNLIVGFAGQLAIGYVALFTLGAYTASVLAAGTVLPELPLPVAFAAAAVVGAVCGVLVGLPALRLRTFYFAMTTLGFATIVTQVALGWQSVTGGGVGIAGPIHAGAVRYRVGAVLPLPRHRRGLHLDDRQHCPQPLRPRADRHAGGRGRRRGLRHLQTRFADQRVPVRGRGRGRRGRVVRQPADLHHAGRLHLRPVAAVLHRRADRRARVDPGAVAGHHHPDIAAGDRRPARRLVHLRLRRAAAGDRAGLARRHRRADRFPRAAARCPANASSSRIWARWPHCSARAARPASWACAAWC